MSLFKKAARHTTIRRENVKEAALILGWTAGIFVVDIAGGIGSSLFAAKLLTMPLTNALICGVIAGPTMAGVGWAATWNPLMRRLHCVDHRRNQILTQMAWCRTTPPSPC